LIQDRRKVVAGPFLDDHPVRKAVDVDGVTAHPTTGRRDPEKIPFMRRLDDVADGGRVVRRDDVLLRRVEVGQRTDEAAQHLRDVRDALDYPEQTTVPLHLGREVLGRQVGIVFVEDPLYSRTISMFDRTAASFAMKASFVDMWLLSLAASQNPTGFRMRTTWMRPGHSW
jgi:hypothetical protein